MTVLANLMPYFKALDEGKLEEIDIPDFSKKFNECAVKAGDHLQFKLHMYCKQDLKDPNVDSIVIQLTELCYSEKSIMGFKNMDRFLGCIYHIAVYLLKRKHYDPALDLLRTLEKKQVLIIEAVENSNSSKNVLINLHIQLINAAQVLLPEISSKSDDKVDISHRLAEAAVEVLQYITVKSHLPKVLIRNMNYYFSSLKYYSNKHAYDVFKYFMNFLKIFEPKFKETNFLCYYIFEMDRGEGSSDEQQINEYFKRRINLFLVFLKETSLMKYWNVIVDFFIAKISESSNIKNVLKAFEELKEKGSKLNLLVLSIVFNYGVQLWWKLHADDWNKVFSVEFVQTLFDGIILPLRYQLGDLSVFCSSVIPQMVTCLSDLLTSNLQKILYTIRLCLKNNIQNSLMLVDVLRRAFKITNDCLVEMSKNECCLPRRKHSWSHAIIHYTNTIEDILKHSTVSNCCDYLRNCCQELICTIIKSDIEIPYDWQRLVLLFQRWHYANLKLQDYRECLFVCAVYLSAYSQNVEDIFSMWLQTKSQVADEKFENLTIGDVLKKDVEKIKALNPKYEATKLNWKKLLLMELKTYSSSSSSNFRQPSLLHDSANRIWKQLENFKIDIYEKAFALNCVIDLAISGSDSRTLTNYQQECELIIDELMRKDGKNKARNLFYVGNLKFSLFQLNLKSIQQTEDNLNSADVILDYLKKEEEEKVKFGEDVDLNLTCNIVPSSSNLTVELEEKYLVALNETVEIWQKAAQKLNGKCIEDEEFKSWLYNIKQVANMYQLVGDYYQGLISWLLYYKIGKISEDCSAQLLGISCVLEDCFNLENCDLVEEAESLAEKVVADEKNRNIVIKYWLTMGTSYLRAKNPVRCFIYLAKIRKVLESLKKHSSACIFNARFWCLTSHFICLYPEYMKELELDSDTDVRVVIYKAFGYISSGIKDEASGCTSQTEYAELMLTLLEISMAACQYFGVYMQTNFMRLFLDDLYRIAQKLVLPTRTAEILVRLAEVDMMCEKIEDCQIKLNKLRSILMMDSFQLSEAERKSLKDESAHLRLPKDHQEESISPRALSPARFVDTNTKYRQRDASPYFSSLADEKPAKKIDHSNNCRCLSCRNILIQMLIVDALAIEGQYHAKKGQFKKAYSCFRRGYETIKRLENNRVKQNENLSKEIEKVMSEYTNNLNFKIDVTRYHSARFLLNYAFFELSPGIKGDVIMDVANLIKKIDGVIGKLSYEEKLLRWGFVELKLTAFVLAKMNKEKPKAIMRSPVAKLSLPLSADQTKTPMVGHVAKRKESKTTKKEKGTVKKRPLVIFSDDSVDDAAPVNPPSSVQQSRERERERSSIHSRKLFMDSDEDSDSSSGHSKILQTVKKAPKLSKINSTSKKEKHSKRKENPKQRASTVSLSEDDDASYLSALSNPEDEIEGKESNNDVSVDLFASFEEKLKITDDENPKRKKSTRNVLSSKPSVQKSDSVEILEVKRVSTRSMKKK